MNNYYDQLIIIIDQEKAGMAVKLVCCVGTSCAGLGSR